MPGRLLLLIPTTSYRAEDFLAAAERLGVAVTVGSDRASVLAQFDPAATLELPFGQPDDAVARIAGFHAAYPLAAIVGVDEGTATIAARASHRLSLPHNDPEAVAAASDKYRFRRVLSEAGVPQPTVRLFSAEDDPPAAARQVNQYPVVLKPRGLAGSRGVIRADDAEGFAAAFARIGAILAETDESTGLRADPWILAEEYLDAAPGGEVAVEGLLIGGRLHVLAIFDKPEAMQGPTFEETIFTTPSRHDRATQDAIVAQTQRAIAALGLTDGPVHAELRITPEHGPVPLEVAARSIGGLCGRVLQYGTGLTLEDLILAHALGRDPGDLRTDWTPAGVMMLPVTRAGTLAEVRGQGAARAEPGILDLRITIAPGTHLRPLPEGDRYLGFLFARAATPEAVETTLRRAAGHLETVLAEDAAAGG
jgi:biotin carboxylase